MKSLASRVAALERKRKKVISHDGYKEERFTGKDGRPWVRYGDGGWFSIELPCNGRDDPLAYISQRVDSGEAMPDGLLPEEIDSWQVSLMDKLGSEMIKRLHAGEIDRAALTPQELDCVELVEAVRNKY